MLTNRRIFQCALSQVTPTLFIPGSFIELAKDLDLDTHLDCLLVALPGMIHCTRMSEQMRSGPDAGTSLFRSTTIHNPPYNSVYIICNQNNNRTEPLN